MASFIGIGFTLKNSASYLALNKPEYGHYLVVEGWQSAHSLKQALIAFRDNQYRLVITTGGPDTRTVNASYKTFAEKSTAFLISQGLEPDKIITIPTPASAQDRTFLSAVMVREWLANEKITPVTLDVYTESVHARRTHTLYKLAFKADDIIGVYASTPVAYQLKSWWQSSEGAKSVLTELAGIAWVTCCFNPGKYGSHQEKWGLPGASDN